jgi:hypothetical protein
MMAVNDALEGKKYIEFTNYQLAQMRKWDEIDFRNDDRL